MVHWMNAGESSCRRLRLTEVRGFEERSNDRASSLGRTVFFDGSLKGKVASVQGSRFEFSGPHTGTKRFILANTPAKFGITDGKLLFSRPWSAV